MPMIKNQKALFKYTILEKIEAGIVLNGAEIKSIRAGRANLSEAYGRVKDGEVFLVNVHILPWMGSEKYSESQRERKLLLHKKQILYLQGKISAGGLALVPLSLYIRGNLAKVELALAKSKAKFDKRASLKKKTEKRDIDRAVRGEKY